MSEVPIPCRDLTQGGRARIAEEGYGSVCAGLGESVVWEIIESKVPPLRGHLRARVCGQG